MKHIRDALYGDIELSDEFIQIVDHPLFQRLRRIKQLALVDLVYPSATHTRFEHSLGVYRVARSMTSDEKIWAYALLHDVGHGPLSHLLETALAELGKPFDHEERTKQVAKRILQDSVFSFKEVFNNRENILVHGGVGADRIDYLQRDSLFTGVRIGFVEWDRLARNVYVHEGKLFIKKKAIPNAEHLFIARFILGDAVYFHKTVLVADKMFTRAVEELLEYYNSSELQAMDDIEFISALRRIDSYWWRRIEERKLFKIAFMGGEDEARELYEKLVASYGEESVLIGHRPTFYSRPDVYIETGESLLQASPLIRALKRSEEGRKYWFVAIDPLKIPQP